MYNVNHSVQIPPPESRSENEVDYMYVNAPQESHPASDRESEDVSILWLLLSTYSTSPVAE